MVCHRYFCRIMACLLPAGWLIAGCTPQNEYVAPPPPEVKVAVPLRQATAVYLEQNGQAEAVEQAEVRARVKGFLQEVRFQEDTPVQQGDVLYLIEPDRYEAARDAAQAQLNSAQASVTRTQQEFDRQKKLLTEKATAESKVEQAEAELAAAKAEVDIAAAALKSATLDIDYTTVTAPISGKISKTLVKVGNLVEDGTQLATIVDSNPIFVNFNISERDLLMLERRARERAERAGEPVGKRRDYRELPAFVRRDGDQGFPFRGRLDYVDTEGIDQATGTLAVRARLDNADNRILQGMFMRVRVPIQVNNDTMLLPERAVGRDQLGSFVLVVGEGNVVERKAVTIGNRLDDMVIIEQGLEGTERVIIDGLQKARPGNEVAPEEITLPVLQSLVDEVKRINEELSEPVPTEPAAEGPAASEPEPAKPEPAKPEPAKPEPAKPASTD